MFSISNAVSDSSENKNSLIGNGYLRRGRPVASQFLVEPDDVMGEVGSGLGRVLMWWNVLVLKNRMIGIEKNPKVAKAAARVFRHYPNVEIPVADAAEATPPEGTFYFINNPLDPAGVNQFQNNIKQHAINLTVRVLYCLARHQTVFSPEQGWARETFDLGIVRNWNPIVRIVPT